MFFNRIGYIFYLILKDITGKHAFISSGMIQENYQNWLAPTLQNWGVSDGLLHPLSIVVNIVLLSVIYGISYFIIKHFIRVFAKTFFKKSARKLREIFVKKKVFDSLAHLFPAMILFYAIPLFFDISHGLIRFIHITLLIYMIIIVLFFVIRILHSLEELGMQSERFKDKPLASYVQIIILIVCIITGILIISVLIGRSPFTVITAFSAATAVFLLIFKDTLLGLVASIQVSANDMVRLGDWITMEKYGVGGNIIEINLMSIKVRNWDQTVVNVPTYALISDSFQNWRGMQEMGIRRMKKNVLIDVNTISEISSQRLAELKKRDRIKKHFPTIETDSSEALNRTVTNVELFRKYAENYLNAHPDISDIIVKVRLRQVTPTGLPIQVYAFSNFITFVEHENTQAIIFEHLYSVVSDFGLRLFQRPAGDDVKSLSNPSKNTNTNEDD